MKSKKSHLLKWLLPLLFLLVRHQAFSQPSPPNSQLIPNGHFQLFDEGTRQGVDFATGGTVTYPTEAEITANDFTGEQHFGTGRVTNWKSSHGTPNIGKYAYTQNRLSGGDNTESNAWANLFAVTFSKDKSVNGTIARQSEGIFTDYTFKQGIKYTISLKLATYQSDNIDNVRIYLANGLVHRPYNSAATFPPAAYWTVPTITDKQLVSPNITNFSSDIMTTGFTERVITFIPDKDYAQFWIYPDDPSTSGVKLYIDDVKLVDCPDFAEYISTTLNASTNVTVQNYITASGSTIVSNAYVHFKAGNYIELLPDFAVTTGSEFDALIGDCNGSGYRLASSSNFNTQSFEENINSQSFKSNKVLIYPNPSTSSFTIEGNPGLIYRLFNSQGSEVRQGILKDGSSIVNTENLKRGLYFLHTQHDSKIEKHQIVIQ